MKDEFDNKNHEKDCQKCDLDSKDCKDNGKKCGSKDQKKCCDDMDVLRADLEALSKEYDAYKDKLYQYAAHISRLQSMLDRVPGDNQKQKIQFCSNMIALYNNLSLIKNSDQYIKSSDEMKALLDFFEKEILRILAEYNVNVIYPKEGDECDYDICAAESVVDGEKSNRIVKVYSPAFKMGDMCIARSRVTVSKSK